MMAQYVHEVMTPDPVTIGATASVREAARVMQAENIGTVIVLEQGIPIGIVTDRDLVVRVLAEGRDAAATTLGEICSRDLVTVALATSIEQARVLLQEKAIRRLVVVEQQEPVGLISLTDLTPASDPESGPLPPA
jgi:CBS domain-containing protein